MFSIGSPELSRGCLRGDGQDKRDPTGTPDFFNLVLGSAERTNWMAMILIGSISRTPQAQVSTLTEIQANLSEIDV